MAKSWNEVPVTMVSNGNMSAKQYYLCKLHTVEGEIIITSNAADRPFGVVTNEPAAGEEARVVTVGSGAITKVVSDGSTTAIAINDLLGTDANGKAIKKATDADLIIGIALQASAADGKVIEVLMTGGQRAS